MKTAYLKAYNLLTDNDRRGALMLLVLMMIGMVLETLGIGLIIPAITLMMQGDLVRNHPTIASFLQLLGNPSQSVLIIFSMVGLVSIYLVKNLFLGFLIWKQANFIFKVQTKLSHRLFSIYLRQPYTFHLQRNSAELVRNVGGEATAFSGVISSAQMLISELMVLTGITVLLLFVEPIGALIVAVVLGGAAWSFHRITRDRISRWGVERQIHDGLRIQHLQQGLGGAKDVKLLGRESDFLDQYYLHNIKSARVSKFQSILQSYPRLMFELLAVTGLAILVISMLSQGRNMGSIIPTLGLFAAAAFRLMPSVNRILNSVQSLRYSLPVVNLLYEEINLASAPVVDQTNSLTIFTNRLSLNNIKFQYSGAASFALDGISINIKKGETVGFIGESGSGKSTLIDVILGLLTPSDGHIEVDSQDIQQNLRAWQDQIGYVPQSIYLTDDTFRRNIAFGLPNDQSDDAAVKHAIDAAQLEYFVSSLPDGIETIVGERGVRLSGGQRQRIGIARALYHNPDVLVLDEATSALDKDTEDNVMDAIGRLQSKTIIIIAHRLSTLNICNKIYKLNKGKIVDEGLPSKFLKSEGLILSNQL